MHKKIIFVLFFVLVFLTACETEDKQIVGTQIYYIDSQMLRLVSVDFENNQNTVQKQAEAVISGLIEGADYNTKIKRMIPKNSDCLSVRVEKNKAYVDISGESIGSFPDGRVAENLIVYQIVNSLTSIDGIDAVRFTIDGVAQKKFKGFIDMRETFIPDYYI